MIIINHHSYDKHSNNTKGNSNTLKPLVISDL